MFKKFITKLVRKIFKKYRYYFDLEGIKKVRL